MLDAYLDIETTGLSRGSDAITVIGIYLDGSGYESFKQLVGEEVTKPSLIAALEKADNLYTYNGSGFDLPFIRASLGVDLSSLCDHHDLMLDCWRCNLYGGFKAVERQLGINRKLKEVNGYEAVRLWWQYRMGNNRMALETLLQYNREDVVNLKALRKCLETR